MQNTNRGMVSPLGAGIAGAALGAAIGATTIALTNKDNRKKFLKTVTDVRKKTAKGYDELKKMNMMKSNGKTNGKAHNGHIVEKVKSTIKRKIS